MANIKIPQKDYSISIKLNWRFFLWNHFTISVLPYPNKLPYHTSHARFVFSRQNKSVYNWHLCRVCVTVYTRKSANKITNYVLTFESFLERLAATTTIVWLCGGTDNYPNRREEEPMPYSACRASHLNKTNLSETSHLSSSHLVFYSPSYPFLPRNDSIALNQTSTEFRSPTFSAPFRDCLRCLGCDKGKTSGF